MNFLYLYSSLILYCQPPRGPHPMAWALVGFEWHWSRSHCHRHSSQACRMSTQNRFLAQIALMKKREGRYPSRDDPQRQQLLQGQHQSVNRILGRWNGEVSVAAARIDQVRRALDWVWKLRISGKRERRSDLRRLRYQSRSQLSKGAQWVEQFMSMTLTPSLPVIVMVSWIIWW